MRILIIGTGFIGPINTKALMQCEDAEIIGVANRTAKKAETMCRELGLDCPVYTDYIKALDELKPEAVCINVFNDLHKPYFLECAKRGIHILIEKPLANTPQDCMEMIAAAKKAGIRVTVLHTQRYGAVVSTAFNYLKSHTESLGKLCSVTDFLSCHYFWDGRNPWHIDDRRSGGGIVLNYGVHQLDRIHLLTGERTATFTARYLKEKEGVETCSSYTMMGITEGGIPYTATCCGYSGPSVNEIRLCFQHATMQLILAGGGLLLPGVYLGTNETPIFDTIPMLLSDGAAGEEMYQREMQEAMAYLIGKTETPPITMEWATEMVRLCCEGFSGQKPHCEL